METARPFIIALDGRSGSGKTSFATSLASKLGADHSVSVLRLEDMYHGWDGLAAAQELYLQLLPQLAAGQSISWPLWDWANNRSGQSADFTPAEIVIVEGVGASCAGSAAWVDFSIWLEADKQVRKSRALARDGETYSPFWDQWAAQEDIYQSQQHPAANTDLVLNSGGDIPALDQLKDFAQYLPSPLDQSFIQDAAQETVLPRLGSFDAPANVERLFERLSTGIEFSALLESTSHHLSDPLERNQFSLLAFGRGTHCPRLTSRGAETSLCINDSILRTGPSFFTSLGRLWPCAAVEPLDYPLPAWVGYLGYELKQEVGARSIQPVVADNQIRDDALLFAPNIVLVIDHRSGKMFVHANAEQAPWLTEELHHFSDLPRDESPLPPLEFTCADTEAGYKEKIARAQHEIYEGNTYEVCLTTELTSLVEHFSPFEAYCRMRVSSPAPFAHFLKLGRTQVASISPERFLSLTASGSLRAEPIKGTRPRGKDETSDQALKHDLATSPKDRAENIMIVDLLRNDLSHHANPGSVRVTRLCAVESYATVHQMVSTIDAQLRDRALSAQAIHEAFPPGSMTGAPKLSTMNILDELEEYRARGLYSGAVGYLGADGCADFSVVIRTLVCDQLQDDSWKLSVGLGGAITADSDANEEWAEVITKSVGVLSAIGSVFPDSALCSK